MATLMRAGPKTNFARSAGNEYEPVLRRRHVLQHACGGNAQQLEAITAPETSRLQQYAVGRADRAALSIDIQFDSRRIGRGIASHGCRRGSFGVVHGESNLALSR